MEKYKVIRNNLVSVILPTYNGELFIADTLQSVLDQTYKNLEVIIIDDASTDKTVEVIRSFNDDRIKLYVNETNLGIGENSNKALSLATGEFIMMQDHDDISSPSRIELQHRCLIDNPNITGVALHVKSFKDTPPDDIYKTLDNYNIDKNSRELKALGLYHFLTHPTLFYRKSILDKLDSYYSSKFTIAGDLYFIERLNSVGASWILLKDDLLAYRIHPNMTTTKYKKPQIYREVLEISLLLVKRHFAGISDSEALMHAKLLARRELLEIDNITLISHFKKILALNISNDFCDDTTLKKETVIQFQTASILANIYSPIKAFKVYTSIDELKPYTVSFWKFLGEYQKRFFTNLTWLTYKKKRNTE